MRDRDGEGGAERTGDQELRFLVLGPLEVRRDDVPVPLGPPMQRTLLAALILEAPRGLGVPALLERLWGSGREPPATASKSIQKYISNLRKTLGADRLVFEGGYRLQTPDAAIDLAAFEGALDHARSEREPGYRLGILEDALELWRGEPFADLPEPWFLEPVRRRLDELRLALVEERLASLLELGRTDAVIAQTQELLAEHPLRERLWQQRIAALAAVGRQAEALEDYRRLRDALVDQLGIDPSPASRELERRVLQQEVAVPQTEATPAISRGGEGNLPAPTSRTIGREADTATVLAAIEGDRFVTLTGPGGVGKTTLALESARARASDHRAGAWLIELGAIRDADRVARRMADVLGVHDHPTRPIGEHLAVHLAGSDPLLVVDNCEQVLDAAAALIGTLLRASPELRVIATSRQPLGVPGERVIVVDPLAVPPEGVDRNDLHRYAAVQLLYDRGAAAGAVLDDSALDELADICRRLDGIPLAIELAAARLRVFTPSELAAQLGDRFALLDIERREGPSRHQTLQATIDWSFQLLSPAERRLFGQLAVFRGGFPLDAADAVCGEFGRDVAGAIAGFVDRSLLVRASTPGGVTRFRMLDTIRAVAEERLGPVDYEVRRAHAEHYAGLARSIMADSGLPEQDRLRAIGDDAENGRAALAFLLEEDPRGALQVAVQLGHYWNETGALLEGQRWLERALAVAQTAEPSPDPARVLGLLQLSRLYQPSSSERALSTAHEAVVTSDAIGDDRLVGLARMSLGRHHAVRLEPQIAVPLLADALAAFERAGDPLDIAECYEACGIAHRLEEALRRFRELGAEPQIAHALFSMTYRSLIVAGRFDEARSALEESLAISRRLGSRHTAAHAIGTLGRVERLTGHDDAALGHFTHALKEFRAIGDRRCIARMLTGLFLTNDDGSDTALEMLREATEIAMDVDPEASPEVTETVDALVLAAERRGALEAAARWLGAVDAIRDRHGIERSPPDRASIDAARDRLAAALGADRAAELRSDGEAMPLVDIADAAQQMA
jgi:predicted ATPase/DNA-binding SARP family transcriptional activator